MKYESKRNYLYPVLRPYSDDYGDEELKIAVSAEPVEGHVRLSITFDIIEPSIRRQIAAGNAACTAMLYCRETLYRETLLAHKGQLTLTHDVPARYLVSHVAVHPAIVALVDISHSTKTAHPEYGGDTVQIGKFQPLATAQTWYFSVNAAERAAKSVFNLAPDDALLPDMFDIEIDPAERYLTIKANAETLAQFNNIRRSELLTLPSVYMNALVEALAYIKYDHEADGDVSGDGWVSCLLQELNKYDIRLGGSDDTGHSLMHAAQMLLNKPFGDMIRAEMDRQAAPDYAEDDSE